MKRSRKALYIGLNLYVSIYRRGYDISSKDSRFVIVGLDINMGAYKTSPYCTKRGYGRTTRHRCDCSWAPLIPTVDFILSHQIRKLRTIVLNNALIEFFEILQRSFYPKAGRNSFSRIETTMIVYLLSYLLSKVL